MYPSIPLGQKEWHGNHGTVAKVEKREHTAKSLGLPLAKKPVNQRFKSLSPVSNAMKRSDDDEQLGMSSSPKHLHHA